jgi:F0F1-type ATP synthase assembly protein I
MFELSLILNADVYSQRLVRYKTVEDWNVKTRKQRENRAELNSKYNKTRRNKLLKIICAIFVGLLIGILNDVRIF